MNEIEENLQDRDENERGDTSSEVNNSDANSGNEQSGDRNGNGSSDDDNSDGENSGNGNSVSEHPENVISDGEHTENSTSDDDNEGNNTRSVPDFIESSSDDEETDTPVRKKRITHCWNLIETFVKGTLAENFVKEEKFWGLSKTNNTESGIKKYYRCTKVKARGLQCKAGLCMHFDSSNENIYILRSSNDHNCNVIETKSGTGMTAEVKNEIKALFNLKLKPNLIHETVSANHKGNPPSKTQVNNFISSLKTKLYGVGTINVGELRIWCTENSNIPEGDNTPYVVNHEISEDGQIFRFFVSSKTLLKLAIGSKTINADATYKMVWQGYPVLVVGTTDKDRHFHLFGLATCMSEKTADFEFVFKSIKEGVMAAFGEIVEFDALISDAAHSIQNAFKNIFGNDKKIIMCWFHMRKNVQKNAKNMMDKVKVYRLLNDIDNIQLMDTKESFLKAMDLFVEKWKKEKRFIDYFKMEWINKNINWYEGARLLTPSTNNALEATNRVLKAENTLRERLPLSRFKVLIMDIITKYSLKYSIIQNHFKSETSIDLALWTDSFNWAKSNAKIECVKGGGKTMYKILSTKVAVVNTEPLREFLTKNFATIRTVLPSNKEHWKNGQCSCKNYLKKYICEHIVGLAIRLQYVRAPDAARNTPLGEKRKRGRPAKALKALLMQ